jgi:uncharacterized membrane protein YdjX (TVP38/TMEM64 family)
MTRTRHVWPRLLLAAVMLAAVVAGYLLVPDPDAAWAAVRTRLADWRQFVADHLLLAAAAFVLVYVAATALSLPMAVPLSLVGGALFGRWLGTLLNVTAATAGATLAFLASRYVLRDWVRARLGERLRRIEAGVERDGAYYLLTLRLVPAVPFTLINLGMALTPIRVRTFAAVSWVGMLPGGFVFANAGAAAAAVESPRDVLSAELLLALTLLGVVPLVLRWVVRAWSRPPAA